MRTIKILAFLIIAAAAGLAAYGYLGDMTAPQRQITIELPPPGGG